MLTLTSYISAYIRERIAVGKFTGRTPSLVRNRLGLFSEHFGQRPLNRLTEATVHRWLETITDLAPATRSAYLSTVRQFTAWLAKRRHIDHDPCEEIDSFPRPKRTPRALDRAQIVACFAACRDDRDRAVISLAVHCGLRRAEIAGLCWTDYNERSRTLFVVGKGGKERIVPVPREAAAALARVRGSKHGPIIAPTDGTNRNLRPWTIGQIARRVLTDADVKHAAFDGISTHAFRHTAASDVLDECGDLRIVQQMLGHENLTSTAIYLRLANLGGMAAAMEGRDYGHDLPEAA